MMERGIILRQKYIDQITPYIGKDVIKVLTGQRRVGKSYIMRSVEGMLRQIYPEANFIRIDLEDFAFSHIRDAESLHSELMKRLATGVKNYIIIDEVQEVAGFDKVIRSLNLDPATDIYVTGSNSSMLSSEIASRLAGRSVEIRVHPLSYKEFLEFHNEADSDSALDNYLHYGGMPYLKNLPDKSTWREYLAGITDALVYRDIVTRHSVRNNDFLQRILLYLADNIGNIFTAKRIVDYLKSQRGEGTVTSVQAYAGYICEAYLINRVRRWDLQGKRFFEIGEKYYFEDTGIRNAVVGYRPGDIGGLLENVVYNHLISQGWKVNIGILPPAREIDFIAERAGERRYVQVAVNVNDRATAEREFGNLLGIRDNYEKMVVTLRDSAPVSRDGIRMLSLRQFLLE